MRILQEAELNRLVKVDLDEEGKIIEGKIISFSKNSEKGETNRDLRRSPY